MASYPPVEVQERRLSHTFESTQLLTPKQLDRITIDNSHYQEHLNMRRAYSPTVLNRDPRRLGDKNFFLQKDLPVEQQYAITALKLSDTRPWDQIVDAPLKSTNVLNKEVQLPFPQEHPYTSHTPQFAMFPDTHPYPSAHLPPILTRQADTDTNGLPTIMEGRSRSAKSRVHVQTQTGDTAVGVPRPPLPYYVAKKAADCDRRVERRFVGSSPGLPVVRENREMLWDMPRSLRHKRAYTYPAPSLQYSRPPTAPNYLPPPSTGTLSTTLTSVTPVSENTKKAIQTIHSLLARSTTYRDHYTPRSYLTQTRPCSRPDHTTSSRLSCRPWTAESRGKYTHFTPSDTHYYPYLEHAHTDFDESRCGSKAETDSKEGKKEGGVVLEDPKDDPKSQEEPEDDPKSREEAEDDEVLDVETCDAETQTEEILPEQHEDPYAYFSTAEESNQPSHSVQDSATQTPDPTTLAALRNPIDMLTSKLYRLPLIDTPIKEKQSIPVQSMSLTLPGKPLGVHLSKRVGTLDSPSDSAKGQVSAPQQSVGQKLHALSKAARDDSRPGRSGGLVLKPPRSVESTRRMLQIFNGYSKSRTLRRFSEQYQESAPDLRRFSMKEGKRHFINGNHAYYYH